MSEVIGKNYPVRTAALETHENDGSFFSWRNFPGSLPDLPEDGDLSIHTTYACMYASNTLEISPKLDFNTKILLTSRIMHRFQRFLMFWKAECLLFHLETTFPHCFVFVRSKTWHLWKVCLIYWTNAGSSIAVLVKYLSQNTGNTDMYQRRHWETIKQHSGRILTYYELHRTSIRIPACMQISISPKPGVQTTY